MQMTTKVKPIPDGHHSVTPYLTVKDAASALEFYKKAFGATELLRHIDPTNGRVGHAELRIGDSLIMLSDEYPDMNVRSPQTLGGSGTAIHLYVADVDALAKQAVAAGATLTRPVEDQFYDDRGGKLEDPYGHVWWIATHKEDLTMAQIEERAAALFSPS